MLLVFKVTSFSGWISSWDSSVVVQELKAASTTAVISNLKFFITKVKLICIIIFVFQINKNVFHFDVTNVNCINRYTKLFRKITQHFHAQARFYLIRRGFS